jgi:hypothetical protein
MKIKNGLKAYLFFLMILGLILLILHTFKLWKTNIDNVSIFLLIFLGLLPFITAIRKLKWGEFEAEIGNKEIEQLKEELKDVDDSKSSSKTDDSKTEKPLNYSGISVNSEFEKKKVFELHDYLFQLLENDNVIALAKLRVELETLLRKVYVYVTNNADRYYPVNLMMSELIKNKNFDSDLKYLIPIKKVMEICNRALHGENISKDNAEEVIKLGMKSIGYLVGFMNAVTKE